MTHRFRGFRGYTAKAKAYKASAWVLANPEIRQLDDSSWVGVGEVQLHDDHWDQVLYGSYGNSIWASDLRDEAV
jgi:hypothetical protein